MIEQTNNSSWSAAVAANERMSSCRRWIKRVPRGVAKGKNEVVVVVQSGVSDSHGDDQHHHAILQYPTHDDDDVVGTWYVCT